MAVSRLTVCLERIDLNKVAKSAEFSQLLLGVKNSPCEATFLGVDTELKNWLTTHAAARKVTKVEMYSEHMYTSSTSIRLDLIILR